MNRLLLTFALSIACICVYGQAVQKRTLLYYREKACENSPLIKDCKNQINIQRYEQQRLKDEYTHSRLEANGDFLFVPIILRSGGHTAFKWNAQEGTDYYGYDLGESSGHMHVGVTWSKPLLGNGLYKTARRQTEMEKEMLFNNMRMEKHNLERSVTEQYLLCLLDKIQIDFSDSIATLLEQQLHTIEKLKAKGIKKQSDVALLMVEKESNEEVRLTSLQSYKTHLNDLNVLCGIDDGDEVYLDDVCLDMSPQAYARSLFAEQYRLDSLHEVASLQTFNLQYRPRLNMFVNGGMQTGAFTEWYKHFGWSAGLTFSWTLSDGKQKQWKERQSQLRQSSIQTYKDYAEYQRRMRVGQCLSELSKYDKRSMAFDKQLEYYDKVLHDYEKEMQAGQVSVLDYITVLKNKISTKRDYMLLRTNRQLVIVAYNYWNW